MKLKVEKSTALPKTKQPVTRLTILKSHLERIKMNLNAILLVTLDIEWSRMGPFHPHRIPWLPCRDHINICKLPLSVCLSLAAITRRSKWTCNTVLGSRGIKYLSQLRLERLSCRDYLAGAGFWPWLKGEKNKGKKKLGKVVYYCMPHRQHSLHHVLLCLSWQICVRGSGCGRDSAKYGQCSTYTHV